MEGNTSHKIRLFGRFMVGGMFTLYCSKESRVEQKSAPKGIL